MAQPTALETTMREMFLPKLEQQVFSYTYLLERFWGMKKVQVGGTGFNKKLVIAMNPNTGTYEPYGSYRANPADKVTYAQVLWKHYYQNIPISNIELLQNAGTQDVTKITDILDTEFENAEESLKYQLAQNIYGDGSAYAYPAGSSDTINPIDGLDKWIDKTREAGGITSTATANTWWDAYVLDRTSAAAVFEDLQTDGDADYLPMRFRECIGECTDGAEQPTVIVTTRIIWEALAGIADELQTFDKMRIGRGQWNANSQAWMGFEAYNFDGIPVIWDSFCPEGCVYFINENKWEVRALAGANMDMGPLEKVAGSDTKQATILLSWNIMCYKPQRQAIIKGWPTSRPA